MIPSKPFLTLCQELRHAGLEPRLDPGCMIGRGFADLGFEVFAVLAAQQLLSLFTGNVSTMQPADLAHLFSVPDVDELSDLLLQHGAEIRELHFVDQRFWRGTFAFLDTDTVHSFDASVLAELLALALKALLGERRV